MKLTNKESFELALENDILTTEDWVNYKWMAVGWLLHQGMDASDAVTLAEAWKMSNV